LAQGTFFTRFQEICQRNNDLSQANNVNIDNHNIKQSKTKVILIILSSKFKFCLTANNLKFSFLIK
jgi:hypothetical protein